MILLLSARPGTFRDTEEIDALRLVTLVDHLQAVIRETQSRKVENALRDLDTETEARLSLLEVLDVLEKLDSDGGAAKDPISVVKKRKTDEEPDPAQHRILSYEQFIAGRRPRTEQSQLTHNSLAGSESSLVRGFLNRILGMTAEAHAGDDDDEDLTGAFDLGDETDNAQAAIESGQELGTRKKEPASAEEEEKEAFKRKAAQRKATREQILAAAALFGERRRTRVSGPFHAQVPDWRARLRSLADGEGACRTVHLRREAGARARAPAGPP